MADTGNNIGFEITADEKKLKQGVENAQKALKSFITKAEELGSALKKNAIDSANLADKQNQLKSSFDSGSISADRYEKEMADITAQEQRLSASTKTLNTQLANTKRNVKALGAPTVRLGQNFDKNANALNSNGIPAMTSFSQVIQDAPYGMRGMANNIQQMTMQFGYLSKSAGGAKGALKAMISSLAGPAGVLLAVSAVTTILVSYGDELFKSRNEVDKSVIANERLNDALKTQLELRRGLKQGIALTTKIRVAEAKLAGKSEEEQFAIFKKWEDARIETLKQGLANSINIWHDAQKEARKAKNEENEDIQKALENANTDQIKAREALNTAIAELTLAELNEQLRIQEKQKNATKDLYDEGEKDAENYFKNLSFGLAGFANTVKTTFSGIDLFGGDKDGGNGMLGGYTRPYEDALKNIENFRNTLETVVSPKLRAAIIGMVPNPAEFEGKLQKIITSLIDFNDEAESIAQGALTSTFANLGNSIGEAMAQGTNVFEAVGRSILSSIGGFLSSLGEMMIKYGVAAMAYSTATKALLNPMTAMPAAGALIAAGLALTIAGGAISSIASGGGDTKADSSVDYSASKRSNYGSSSSYGASGGGGGTYVFEIAGTKLVGVLKNTLDRNKALGGSLSIT
jgi:hypothetical protein